MRPATDTTKLGLIDLGGVDVPSDAQVYLCSPLPFMESVRRSLVARDVPDKNIHYEVFGPDTWLPGLASPGLSDGACGGCR
jgi:nitric oxide dioxygenase